MATIFGTGGDDTIAAGVAGDLVYGLAGDDSLTTAVSGVGLFGGAGTDSLRADIQGTLSNEGPFKLANVSLSGGNGNDELVAESQLIQTQPPRPRLSVYGAFTQLDGGSGDDVLTTNFLGRVMTGRGAFVEVGANIHGGDGHDSISAARRLTTDTTTEVLISADESGGLGNDIISSISILNATGAGPDTQVSLRDALQGDGGNDQLRGCAELTSTGTGVLTLSGNGNEGTDTIALHGSVNAGDGRLRLLGDGGGGNDRIALRGRLEAETDGALFIDAADGRGDDHLSLRGDVDLQGELTELSVFAGDRFDAPENGHDIIDVVLNVTAQSVGFGFVGLLGQNGNDRLSVSVTANIAGGNIQVDLDGGAGNDWLSCFIAADGPQFSNILAGAGNDRLIASGNNNYILQGGAGSDWMSGGTGSDQFAFGGLPTVYEDMADGVRDWDRITNYSLAEGDVIDLPNGIDDVASFRVVGDDTRLRLIGDGDVIVLKDMVVDDLAADVLFA